MATDNTESNELAPGYYNRLFDNRIDEINSTPRSSLAEGWSGGKAVVWVVAVVVFIVLRAGLADSRTRSYPSYATPPTVVTGIPEFQHPHEARWHDDWERRNLDPWHRHPEDPWEKFAPREPRAARHRDQPGDNLRVRGVVQAPNRRSATAPTRDD